MLSLNHSRLMTCYPQEHRQTHGNTREPLLENITSEYDLELFRKAQARASEDLVIGQRLSEPLLQLFSR